jgi:hypothetical protein
MILTTVLACQRYFENHVMLSMIFKWALRKYRRAYISDPLLHLCWLASVLLGTTGCLVDQPGFGEVQARGLQERSQCSGTCTSTYNFSMRTLLFCGDRYPLSHPAHQLQYGTCMYIVCSEPKEVTPKQESACGTRNATPAEILLPPFEVNVLEEKASLRPRLGLKCSLVGWTEGNRGWSVAAGSLTKRGSEVEGKGGRGHRAGVANKMARNLIKTKSPL